MTEVPPEPCLPSGYDDEFVEPVNGGLQCGICQLPMKDPMITNCGHHFCRGCIEEHLRRKEVEGQSGFCPVDRKAIEREKDVFPNKEKVREILSLAVRCGSEECEWADELRLKELHLRFCPFRVIPCPLCEVIMARKDLDTHRAKQCPRRMVQCDFCQEQHTNCQMEEHLKSCDRYPVHCEKCDAIVSREMLQDHMENHCRKSKLPCYFAELGCKKMDKRINGVTCSTDFAQVYILEAEIVPSTNKRVYRCECYGNQGSVGTIFKKYSMHHALSAMSLDNIKVTHHLLPYMKKTIP